MADNSIDPPLSTQLAGGHPTNATPTPSTRLIDLLNQLEQQGTLGQFYQAGAITLTMYSHRELYNYYQALLSTPRYTDRPSKAAKATAEGCKVATSTVYRALRVMEQQGQLGCCKAKSSGRLGRGFLLTLAYLLYF